MLKYVFAERLSSLCKKTGTTVEELADAIGKSPRTINRYRNAQCDSISFDVIEGICAYFKIRSSYLFGGRE